MILLVILLSPIPLNFVSSRTNFFETLTSAIQYKLAYTNKVNSMKCLNSIGLSQSRTHWKNLVFKIDWVWLTFRLRQNWHVFWHITKKCYFLVKKKIKNILPFYFLHSTSTQKINPWRQKNKPSRSTICAHHESSNCLVYFVVLVLSYFHVCRFKSDTFLKGGISSLFSNCTFCL